MISLASQAFSAPAPGSQPSPLSARAPATASAPANEDHIELIDGQGVSGRIESIADGKVVVAAPGGQREVALADVAEMVLQPAHTANLLEESGKALVLTAAGEPVLAGTLSVAGGKLEVVNPVLGTVKMDLSAVSLLAFPPPGRTTADIRRKLAEVKVENEGTDLLLVGEVVEQSMPVEGVLRTIDAEYVTIDWKGEDRKIVRKKVVAVALAAAKKTPAAGTLLAVDGSVLPLAGVQLAAGRFTIDSPVAGTFSLARSGVASIRLSSAKVASLLDLKPSAVREHGFMDKSFPYRVNRSAGGKPLSLDGKVYNSGLGLHSFCELTYDLGGAYTKFVCTAGIDDAVRPGGDAVLTLLADGKVLGQPLRLTGKDKARSVSLDLAAAKTLTIRVEFGPDQIDVSDHVDLVAVRLIK